MTDWHPILAAVEDSPGRWVLSDDLGKPYGVIEIRRTKDGPRYRVEFRGELIGWSTSLKVACEQVHQAFIRSHGPRGGFYEAPAWGR